MLKEPFRKKALSLLEHYQSIGMTVTNQGNTMPFREFDGKRVEAIPEILDLLQQFLLGKQDLQTFKANNERLTRKHDYWGFKSFSGQGFLNQLNKWSNSSREVSTLLQYVFRAPTSRDGAANVINSVRVELPRLIPKSGLRLASVPTLLSYFWQIQRPIEIPMFQASARKVLTDNQVFGHEENPGQAFIDYCLINDELFELFKQRTHLEGVNPYWFIEHVLWLEYRSHYLKPESKIETRSSKKQSERKRVTDFYAFVPPVLHDLEELAAGKGDNIEFEKKVTTAFKILGFLVEGLGQGHGREPDGVAKWREDGFAILFDAKATNAYTIGTTDRAIIEYINKYEPRLKKEGLKKIYFVLVSSAFAGESNSALSNIRRETGVQAVILMTAQQLLQVVAKRVAEPFSFDMSSFEELLLESGLISDENFAQFLES